MTAAKASHAGVRSPGRAGRAGIVVATLWLASAVVTAVLFAALPFTTDELVVGAAVCGVALVPLTLGAVLAAKRPRHPAGPLLASAGFCLIATNLPGEHAPEAVSGDWVLLYLAFAILLLVLPDGRPASRRWARVGWAIAGVAGAFGLLAAVPAFQPDWADALLAPGFALLAAFGVLLITCAAAPIARYRRSDERARLRLRWVYLAGVSLPLTLMLCWASYLVLGEPDLVVYGLVVMYLAIPASATVSLLRPTLIDVDRATVATLSASALAFCVLGVLSAAALSAGTAMVHWSPLAAVTTTSVLTGAAVIAYPFVRRGLDHVLFPERARTVAALGALSQRVDHAGAAPEEVEATLRAALRDPGLVVGYVVAGTGPDGDRTTGDRTLHTLDGAEVTMTDASTPIRVRGEEIAAIIPSAGRVSRPGLDIARAAAPLVDAARARAQLARANAEVEASRTRLLRAGYEERRKIERDLHDGTQQRLIAVGMRLRVLQRGASHDESTAAALDAAVADLSTAVAELRQLANGVRPSALDDGLAAALSSLALPVEPRFELDVRAGEIPDAVATTAYFVVSEAIANALRHAEASRVRVGVREAAGDLHVVITDDGRGGAAVKPSGGLTGLTDRVAALGGTLRLSSPPGAGTTVEVVLPCAS
jgi:signal transduction histidine kinase